MKNKICVRCNYCGMKYPDHKMSCKIPVEKWRLPTAEELILKKLTVYNNQISVENAVKLMNLYVKLHLEAQHIAILKNVKTDILYQDENGVLEEPIVYVDEDSIKNAYPFNLIK
jgi:hypothetical protein